jgi:hypothetical protein
MKNNQTVVTKVMVSAAMAYLIEYNVFNGTNYRAILCSELTGAGVVISQAMIDEFQSRKNYKNFNTTIKDLEWLVPEYAIAVGITTSFAATPFLYTQNGIPFKSILIGSAIGIGIGDIVDMGKEFNPYLHRKNNKVW